MRSAFKTVATVAALMIPLPVAAGTVDVTFTAPERYTDVAQTRSDSKEGAAVLGRLRDHLVRIAERRLAPDQALTVEVLDVDLAGHYEDHASPYSIRVMRAHTPPRIKVRYSLSENGAVVANGEQTLSDLDYLDHTLTASRDDPLRYERQMLDDWIRATFVRRKPAEG